ncbi:MAG: endonuclease/exonuclease/phosphatase family protein [Patescibacteria group bacterium]|nr:endonuclease/exonuclease/phosphatase family protein [Patescibacteria group bacterium]
MKIYSWNVCYRNADFDAALRYIGQLDFDVLCLQEVPARIYERLKELPYSAAEGVDARWDGRHEHSHVVILTPHKMRASGRFTLPALRRTLRSRMFMHFMRLWGWRYVEGREGVWADISLPKAGTVRIFSLHLGLLYPESRRREFEAALSHADAGIPTVVCGDFNIVESWRVTLLNWLQGGRVSDVIMKKRERSAFEARLARLRLRNPFLGKRTQTISRSQLDHILLPSEWTVQKAEVVAERCGSDHHPIFVEASIS